MRGGESLGYWNTPAPTEVECVVCGDPFEWNRNGSGPRPEYCANKCRQKAYRDRKTARRLADRVAARLAEERHEPT